jgi:sugar (pentulose or hexulose) kinase
MASGEGEALIGIDCGTTVLKAAAFDASSGRLLATAARRLDVAVARDGRREQDPRDLVRALDAALLGLRRGLGARWKRVAGIALAAQGGSMLIADRRSGRPLTPMVLWNDARAFAYLPRLTARRPPAWWRSFSLRDEPGMGLARLLWLKETRPALIAGKNIYVGAGELLDHRLTGAWRQDPCHALQTGCYDAVRSALTDRPLRGLGVPLSFFAPLRDGHRSLPLAAGAARRLELPEGLPVAGPYMDHEAGYLSALEAAGRPLQCSLGTAWVGNFVVSEDSAGGSPFQLAIPSPAGKGRLVIQPLLTGNVTWDWALATLVDADRARALEKAGRIFSEALLPPEGLIALPWLNRPNPFDPGRNGAGAIVGMSPSTTREDLLRAVAAGMAFELARVFEAPAARRAFDRIVLSGGAAKGRHFQALIAALFRPIPTFRVTEEDWMGARGALHGLRPEVSLAAVERVKLPPGIDVDSIRMAYQCYLRTFDRLYGLVAAGRAYSFRPIRNPQSPIRNREGRIS